jgi:hypothetical protein
MTPISRWLLAGSLISTAAQAQSIAPTRAMIRLYQQSSGFALGAEKRVYTSYFNSLRTFAVAVEVTLEYPAAASGGQLSIACQMTRPDGRVIDGIWKIGLSIRAGSTQATGANTMFGPGREGWQTGVYKVTCAGSQPLGETSFQMSPGPSLLSDGELRLKEVKFFPTGSQLNPPGQRNYQDRFSSTEATRIGIELTFLNPGWTKTGSVPIDCYFARNASAVIGTMTAVYEITAAGTGTTAMGLGWDQPGQWSKDDYLAICQLHGRPIAVERFTVW